MIKKFFNMLNQRIECYVLNNQLFRNNKYSIFGIDTLNYENKKTKIVRTEEKQQEEINVSLLNCCLYMVSQLIIQEKEIAKLQNYDKVKNNSFLYNIIYLGMQENFLDFLEIQDTIKMFYQTNRITKNQYLTLINHYYLENKEYEE